MAKEEPKAEEPKSTEVHQVADGKRAGMWTFDNPDGTPSEWYSSNREGAERKKKRLQGSPPGAVKLDALSSGGLAMPAEEGKQNLH